MSKHWGEPIWKTCNLLSSQLKKGYYGYLFEKYMSLMSELLPCDKCKEHFKKLLRDFPFQSIYKFKHPYLVWIYIAHNMVNSRIGKKGVDFESLHNSLCYCDYPDINSVMIGNDNYDINTVFDSLYIFSLQANTYRKIKTFNKLLKMTFQMVYHNDYKRYLLSLLINMKIDDKFKHPYFKLVFDIHSNFNQHFKLDVPDIIRIHNDFCGCDLYNDKSSPTYNYFCPIE